MHVENCVRGRQVITPTRSTRLLTLRPLPTKSPVYAGSTRRSVISTAGGVALGISAALGMSAVVAAAAAARGDDAQALVASGMQKFVKGDVEGSIVDFDAALVARPSIRPYLWQRGLTLYYLQQYQEGAQQFRDDVAVNPSDTEESIWAFLCEAQLVGPEKARENFLQVGRDSRPVMRAAYTAFKTGSGTESIITAAGNDANGHDAFYAWLYCGLYNEAEGNTIAAKREILRALETNYSKGSRDYMVALAKVHCKRRGWA